MNLRQFRQVLQAGHVRRMHTCPSDAAQTNGHHSWGVAVILQYIAPDCSKDALLAALYHDVPEVITGDIPATAKWLHEDMARALEVVEEIIEDSLDIEVVLTAEERGLVKLADSIDLLLFSRHRLFMGDRYFEEFVNNLIKYLARFESTLTLYPKARELIYAP